MGDITRNFSRREFRCPCCDTVRVDLALVDALQRLRDLTHRKMRITSGYRCPKRNAEVGGKKNSHHLRGTGADIKIEGLSVVKTYLLAEQIPEFADGGIGIYPDEGFVHVDSRSRRTRWARCDGQYVQIWHPFRSPRDIY